MRDVSFGFVWMGMLFEKGSIAMRFIIIALWVSIVAVACSTDGGTAEPTTPAATAAVQPTLSPDAEIMEVSVGPELESCVGLYPMMCMVVDGGLFYDAIDGFDFEPGYEYKLRIERYDAWPDVEEPPQDAGKYGYRLIEVIRKTRVQR